MPSLTSRGAVPETGGHQAAARPAFQTFRDCWGSSLSLWLVITLMGSVFTTWGGGGPALPVGTERMGASCHLSSELPECSCHSTRHCDTAEPLCSLGVSLSPSLTALRDARLVLLGL